MRHAQNTTRTRRPIDQPTTGSQPTKASTASRVTEALRSLVLIGMLLVVTSTLIQALGPAGAGLELPDGLPFASSTTKLEATGTLADVPPIRVAEPGPMETTLAGPVTAAIEFNQLPAATRAVNTAMTLASAVIWLSGLALAYRVLGEVRKWGPFTPRTHRKLLLLAAVIAIGGTSIGMLQGAVDASLIRGSFLNDVFAVEYRLTLIPLIGGAAVALMALLIREGVIRINDAAERA